MNRPLYVPGNTPQFHPVRAEDVQAHATRRLSRHEKDAVMGEVEAHRNFAQMQRWSHAETHDEYAGRLRQRDETMSMSAGRSTMPPLLGAHAPAPNIPLSASVGPYASAASTVHQRADSNSSAAIVAQLASALQPDALSLDDNPFEPIPLPGRSKKKPKTEGGNDGKW